MKIKRFTINKFELSEERDYFDLSYVLASSVTNGNGALLTEEELANSKDTILHQPLIIVPDFDDMPTGHSIEDFPKLGWGAMSIGTHIGSEIIESEDGVKHLKATARVWKIRYPEVADVMLNLFEVGELKFSMEAKFKSQTVEGSTRTLHGVNFIGSAVVDDPANPFSYALEVANKNKNKKEEKVVDLKQALAKLKEHDADAYVLVDKEISSLQEEVKKIETLENAKTSLTDSLEKANNKVDELNNEVATLKDEQEKKELAEKQDKRFNEISEYIEFTEEEIASKKESFGKMDEETFNLVLETAKRNKKEESSSNASFSSDTRLEISDSGNFLDGLGE